MPPARNLMPKRPPGRPRKVPPAEPPPLRFDEKGKALLALMPQDDALDILHREIVLITVETLHAMLALVRETGAPHISRVQAGQSVLRLAADLLSARAQTTTATIQAEAKKAPPKESILDLWAEDEIDAVPVDKPLVS